MQRKTITGVYTVCTPDELTDDERRLVRCAIDATERSYAKYSHFRVGAALLLDDGDVVAGCNQENASFPVTICAERAALFAAGAKKPDVAPVAIAIAARNGEGLTGNPVTPCGSCRQAMIETEQRYGRSLRILLYGTKCVYVIDGIRQLMPLSFTEDLLS